MKSLIILFAGNSGDFSFENTFGGKSAFYKTLEWAKNVGPECGITVLATEKEKSLVTQQFESFKSEFSYSAKFSIKLEENWTNEKLFSLLTECAEESGCDYVFYSSAFCPFLNIELTKKLISTHEEYKSEYCFADGYPYGVSPEILDKGLCKILSELIKSKDELKNAPVTKDSVFDLMKTDINSFEIETEISEIDWRLYRFSFCSDKKENHLLCRALYDLYSENPEAAVGSESLGADAAACNVSCCDVQKLISLAANNVKTLKTIPAFFNIQITGEYKSDTPFCAYTLYKDKLDQSKKAPMSLENFKALVKNIADFNPDAVVSLSLWGECLLHPDFFEMAKEVLSYPGLSLLIETSGFDLGTEGIAEKLESLSVIAKNAGLRKNGYPALIWIVYIDAMSQNVYQLIHPGQNLERANASLKLLNNLFPDSTYAQFLRVNQNEDELESFFRTYKEKDYLSGGRFIIQKYDNFCGELPDYKVADLSPIDRLPCWHLRRDMNILCNGDVPVCKNMSFEAPVGNVFTQGLKEIWSGINAVLSEQIEKKYCKGCSNCDEFYTFNF